MDDLRGAARRRPDELDDPVDYPSAVPASRHYGAFAGARLPRPPSFNETDVSDKPPFIRRRPPAEAVADR